MLCSSSRRSWLAMLAAVVVAAFMLAGTSPTALAQEAIAPAYQPADVQTQVSRAYVFVDKTGLGHQHGVEAKLLPSTLVLGADHNAGKLVFDMTSFDADTTAARKYVGLDGTTDQGTRSAVNHNMKGSAILNVAKYPTATFDIASAIATDQTSAKGLPVYELKGNFTLHGTTRPLAVTAEVEQARGWLHVRGSFVIKQTSFGITPYSKAFGAIGVADPLRIYGDLFVAPTDKVAMADFPSVSNHPLK